MLSTKLRVAMAAGLAVVLVKAQQEVIQQTTVVVIDYVPAVSYSTAYLTDIITVLGCPPGTPNCPVANRNSVVVVTATTGVTTTVCPLTLRQARLSSYITTATAGESSGGPLSTTTTTWPTTYDLPSSYSLPSSYDIPSSVWASLFPSGVPSVTYGQSHSPSDLSALSALSELPYSTSISVHESISTIASNSLQSISITSGAFTAILGSNQTSVVVTYGASTLNYTAARAAPSGYGNASVVTGAAVGSGPSAGLATATSASNSSSSSGAPVPLQTVNDSPVAPVPVNQLFGLLVALSALAMAL